MIRRRFAIKQNSFEGNQLLELYSYKGEFGYFIFLAFRPPTEYKMMRYFTQHLIISKPNKAIYRPPSFYVSSDKRGGTRYTRSILEQKYGKFRKRIPKLMNVGPKA